MDSALRGRVRDRAGSRCEYCHLREVDAPFVPFHLEPVIPRKHGGDDATSNLAFACFHCNLHKGPNLTGIDDQTGEIVPLFHPRRQNWEDHFELCGAEMVGRTAVGRATVRVLAMNSVQRLELRSELQQLNRR